MESLDFLPMQVSKLVPHRQQNDKFSLQCIGEGKAANVVVSTIPLSLSSLAPSYSDLSFFFV